jgi:AcrR family transcriptional regulator
MSIMSDVTLDRLDELDPRRAAVLKAALDVFTSYGFRRTTMDDIARAAGMSRPALYTHFRNKEAIFRTFVEMFLGAVTRDARSTIEARTNVADGLEAFFDAAFVAPFRELMATPHGMELAGVNAELCGDLTEQWFGELESILGEWLERATLEGRLKLGGLRSAALARLLINAVEGIKSRGSETGHHEDPAAIMAEMALLAQMTARAYAPR